MPFGCARIRQLPCAGCPGGNDKGRCAPPEVAEVVRRPPALGLVFCCPGVTVPDPQRYPGSRDVGRARFRSKTLRIMSVHDEIADAFVIIRYGFLACPKPSSLKVPVSAKEDPRLALLNYMALLRMAARVVSFK